MATKKLTSIFLLYDLEGFLQGFALTIEEANKRGYTGTSLTGGRPFYREVRREHP